MGGARSRFRTCRKPRRRSGLCVDLPVRPNGPFCAAHPRNLRAYRGRPIRPTCLGLGRRSPCGVFKRVVGPLSNKTSRRWPAKRNKAIGGAAQPFTAPLKRPRALGASPAWEVRFMGRALSRRSNGFSCYRSLLPGSASWGSPWCISQPGPGRGKRTGRLSAADQLRLKAALASIQYPNSSDRGPPTASPAGASHSRPR